MTSSAPWSAEDIRQNAHSWTLEGDAKLLEFMQNISNTLESRADQTNRNLNQMVLNLNQTSISLENSANKLAALQHSQFVENRVYDDDETIANRSQVPVEVESDKDNYNPIETLNKVLKSGIATLSKCYDKVSIDVEDSDDEEGLASSVIFRPKDPYEQRLLPHVIGSKEWKEKWHIGLCESEEDYSDEENKEDFSNSSENGSLSASIPSNAPTMSESESSIWGLQPNPPKKRPALYAPSSDEDISSNTATSKTSSDGRKKPLPTSQFNHNLVLPPPEEKYYVHKPKDKGLFDESSDESEQEFKIPKKVEKSPKNVISNIFNDEPPELDEVDRKQEKNNDKLFYDSGNDDEAHPVVGVSNNQPKSDLKTSNILKKPVNLFDDDDFDSFMQELDKKAVEKLTQNTGKETVKNLFDNCDENEDLFTTSKTKPVKKQDETIQEKSQPEQKKKIPENGLAKSKLFDDDGPNSDFFSNFSNTNAVKNAKVGVLKTKITNLFDDDSPDDDFDSLFGNSVKKIERKQSPKLPEKESAETNKGLLLGPDNKEMPLPAIRKTSDLFADNSVNTIEDDLFGSGKKQPVAVPRTLKSASNNILVNNNNDSLNKLKNEGTNSILHIDDNSGKDSKIQKEVESAKPEISKSTSIKAANLFTDELSDEDDLFKTSSNNNTSVKTSTTNKSHALLSKPPSFFLDEASDEEDLFKTLKTSVDKNVTSKEKDLSSDSIKEDSNSLPKGRIETVAYIEKTFNDSDSESMDTISADNAINIGSEKVNVKSEKPLQDDDMFITGKNVEDNSQSNSERLKESLSLKNDETLNSSITNKIPNLFSDEPPDDDDLFNNWKYKPSKLGSKIEERGYATESESNTVSQNGQTESSSPINPYQSEKLPDDTENIINKAVSDKPNENFDRLVPKSELEEKSKNEPKPEINVPEELIAEPKKSDENKAQQVEKISEISTSEIKNTKSIPERSAFPSLFDDEPPIDDDWLPSSIKTNTKTANKTDETPENYKENIKNTSALPYNPLSLFQDVPPEDDFHTPSETKRLYNIFYDDFSETITSTDISSKNSATNYFFSDEPPPDNFDNDNGIENDEKKSPDVKHELKTVEELDEIAKVEENLSKPEIKEIVKESSEIKIQMETGNVEQTLSKVKTLDQDSNVNVETNVSVADLIQKASTEPQKPLSKSNIVIPKKLNTNLNINVAALIPGAKRPSLKCEENEKASIGTPVEEVKQESIDTATTVAHSESDPSRLISFNKTRAKIQVKRRPSTRQARQQSYERFASHDIDNSDASPDHSTESKSSSDNQTLNMIPSLPESPTSSLFETGDKTTNDDDDWTASKQNPAEINQNFEQNNNQNSNTLNKIGYDKTLDSAANLSAKSKPKLLTKQPAVSSSPLFGDDSDEEDLFGQLSFKTKSKEDPPKNTKISENRPEKSDSIQIKQQSSSKLFSSDEDDDDIFGKSTKTTTSSKPAEKIVAKKLPISTSKNLFDDDDDEDDLFGGPHSKQKAKRTMVPKKVETKSSSTHKGISSSDNPLADLLKD